VTQTRETQTAAGQREGVLVRPEQRLSPEQVRLVDGVSREMLEDPGLLCYNDRSTELFAAAGATVEAAADCARIRVPAAVLDRALETAPSTVVLGAPDPGNRLVLDATEPRVRFVSGSETNIWLHVGFDDGQPRFERQPGGMDKLCKAAHLCQQLEHLDAFIRCVNIQDPQVTEANKDVNKYLASLNHMRKHVMAGLTSLAALDDVVEMGRMIAGGAEAFERNPVLSFITCVVKSPLQIVDDTAEKLLEIARRRVPVVISSCPMGGATGPFDEFGMVAQINAELLAGVALAQLARPGAPVLYGAVPVRTRLDNLNDMYGAPEFNHYNIDCAQMARFYSLPCYSTAGVADAETPGIQATAEKLLTLMSVPRSGAQYIHYAFGLLERTNVFCPEQAVMDDAHIGLIKHRRRDTAVDAARRDEVLATTREIMQTQHKTYIYHLPMPTKEDVYVAYPLEHEHGALYAAHQRYHELLAAEPTPLDAALRKDIAAKIPGVLPRPLDPAIGDDG